MCQERKKPVSELSSLVAPVSLASPVIKCGLTVQRSEVLLVVQVIG